MGGENLNGLMALIETHYVFDGAAYPRLANAAQAEVHDFAFRHILLHLSENVGRLSRHLERCDHGRPDSVDPPEKVCPDLLIDVLRLAGVIGLSGDDLLAAVRRKYGAAVA